MDPPPDPYSRMLPSERPEPTNLDPTITHSRSGISTRKILQSFQRRGSSAAGPYAEHLARKAEQRVRAQAGQAALKKHLARATTIDSVANALTGQNIKLPEIQEHGHALAEVYAAPRSQVTISVTDFMAESGKTSTDSLGHIEQYMDSKPDDVVVRWIHVPIGRGTLQSTIEDMFNYAGNNERGKPFDAAGIAGWPYPTMLMTSFFDHNTLREHIDAIETITNLETHGIGVLKDPLYGFTPRQQHDLNWRAKVLNRELKTLDFVGADMPLMLEETIVGDASPLQSRRALGQQGNGQVLSKHKQFEDTMIMMSELRAFHRSDGFVLTFANQSGVDYLCDDFKLNLSKPMDTVWQDPEASVFGHTMDAFLNSGVSRWSRQTPEWLIVYLFTEVAVTPHNIRHGRNAISYLQAYSDISKELKTQQDQSYDRSYAGGERFKLVHRYVDCIQSMKAIRTVTQSKISAIRGMQSDCKAMEEEYAKEGVAANEDASAETFADRLDWASSLLKEQGDDVDRLIAHFEDSLGIVFQQQTIELNELAITTESQNKAILLFTSVTVVFLPLSFFTSYFGMNLSGLARPDRNESWFWEVCGTATLVIVLLMFVTAFRHKLLQLRMDKLPLPLLHVSDHWKKRGNGVGFGKRRRGDGDDDASVAEKGSI